MQFKIYSKYNNLKCMHSEKGTAVVPYTHINTYNYSIILTFLASRMKICTTTVSILYLFRNNQTKELIIKLNNLVFSLVLPFLTQTNRVHCMQKPQTQRKKA